MALELAWIDIGEDVLHPDFDHVREAVLGATFSGALAIAKDGNPDDTSVRLTWDRLPGDEEPFIIVVASLYGIGLATRSRGSVGEPDERLITIPFGP
jgi:hypothetical protein